MQRGEIWLFATPGGDRPVPAILLLIASARWMVVRLMSARRPIDRFLR
jgi:hypothetical protein